MIFIEILENLCEQNNTSVTAVLKELGLSSSKGTAWRKGSIPTGDTLVKLAQYFGVSVDYLLGYTPQNEYDTKTEKLINFASKLSENQIDALIEMCSKLLDT